MLIDADTILQINSKWPLNVYYKEISHIYQANKKKKSHIYQTRIAALYYVA